MNLFHSPFGNLFRFLSRLDQFFSRRTSRRFFLPLFLMAILFPLVSYEKMGALGEEADGDRSVSWRIVLPDNPQPVEETAAKELQTHLTEMTGDDYPILSESELSDPAGPAIFVGATRKGTEILQTTHPSPLKFDEIFLQAIPDATSPALILTGHERRGALYAVYTYLEDICGCRWYTPDATVVPKRETIPFPDDLKIEYAPQIISREVYNDLAFPNPFSARNKGNGHIHAEYGG